MALLQNEEDCKRKNFYAWSHSIHTGSALKNAEMIAQQVDWVPGDNHSTLLGGACAGNRPDLARFLLEDCKANVDALDGDGWTALMFVAWTSALEDENRCAMVEFLLRHGADKSIGTPKAFGNIPAGSDAAAIALACGQWKCAEMLSTREAPPAPPVPPLFPAADSH